MTTKHIPLIASAAAVLTTPWNMTRLEILIWGTLVYLFTSEVIKLFPQRKKSARPRTKPEPEITVPEYELVGIRPDGSIYIVEGSEQ